MAIVLVYNVSSLVAEINLKRTENRVNMKKIVLYTVLLLNSIEKFPYAKQYSVLFYLFSFLFYLFPYVRNILKQIVKCFICNKVRSEIEFGKLHF